MQKLLFLLLSVFALAACSDEESPLPDYVQDLADLHTNSSGQAFCITFDDGHTCSLTNRAGGLKADTIYRVLALYTREADNVWLTDFAQTLAPAPAEYDKQPVKHDAVKLMAIWHTPRYINLRFQVKGTSKGTHYFGFKRFDIISHANGTKTLPVKLIHNQNDDLEYYTRESFISLPLAALSADLQVGIDSVCVIVNTYEGETKHTFAY